MRVWFVLEASGRSLLSTKPGFGLTGHQGQTQLVLSFGTFILLDLEVILVSRVACVVARLMPFRVPLGPCSELVWDMGEDELGCCAW